MKKSMLVNKIIYNRSKDFRETVQKTLIEQIENEIGEINAYKLDIKEYDENQYEISLEKI
jgi:hypothetical protein